MRSRYKKWAKPYLENHPEFVLTSVKDDPSFFGDPLYLEVGAGKGAFLLQLATRYPDRRYLALERDISICGVFAKKIDESGLANIRLIPGDFDDLYDSLKEFGFAGIFLNFSDPWPKKRHAKRRLTTSERLKEFMSLLKKDGLLKIKTDNDILYEFTLEEGEKASLNCVYNEPNYTDIDPEDAMSEYEASFREEGKPIHRVVYKKI